MSFPSGPVHGVNQVARLAPNLSAHIDDHFEEHLELAATFVRQPSISASGMGIKEMAELVADSIRRLRGEATIIPTEGNPVVLGNIEVGAPKTLLIYGMYDVQPVEGEEWVAPPFGGQRVDLPDFGECIVSRGIMNSKGPLAGTFSVLESLQRVLGRLPLNVKFVVEGEEELGSRNLPAFVRSNKDKLRADGAFFPFYSQDLKGKVVLYLGTKGLVFLEFAVRGGDWGGPRSRGVHGMNGAWLHNPAWTLVHALSSMLNRDQTEILISDIYDDVEKPNRDDERHLDRLGTTFDAQVPLREQDAVRFKFSLTGADLMRRFLFEPNITIDGIAGGYSAEGMKTLLPHEATAKVDVRLVPRMDPDKVVASIRRHLDTNGFPEVEVTALASYPWSKSGINDPINAALVGAYREFGCEPEVWPLIPGSAPIYLFTRDLGMQFALGGLGHGGRQHSPNEYATVAGMKLYEKSAASFILRFAE
jgi:acetylornithine deacetylase/succinyl-diaminopimelate desuccinylase-like protein